nr:bacterio-opsin activator domain-containing protein [Halomarina salina]
MERKQDERPVLLPFLFVISQRELDRLGPDLWQRIDAVVRNRVDELITAPIKKAELKARIDNLLNSRGLSVQLRDQREQYRRLLSVAPETITTVDSEGTISYLNARGAELFGVDDPADLYGESLFEFLPEDDCAELAALIDAAMDGEPEDEDSEFTDARFQRDGETRYVEVGATPITYDGEQAVQLVIRDVTERRQRERQIERQRDALRTLDRLNEVIRSIDQSLVRASTRGDIEQAVCDRLVEVDRYVAAWIGTDSATSRDVTPRATAGALDDYLDAVTISASETSDPAGRTVASGEATLDDDVTAAGNEGVDPGDEPWRDAAVDAGFASAIAVPIVYEDTRYGALAIYSDQQDAFAAADEVAVLRELGETIGHAITAAESKRALLTDRIAELEFDVQMPESFLARVSEAVDGSFEFAGMVSTTDGSYLEYYSAPVSDPGAVLDERADGDAVEHLRHVGDHGGEALFEVVFSDDHVVQAVGSLGGRTTGLSVEDGVYRVTAEFPYDVDRHAIADALAAKFDAATLRAQRETERELSSRQEVWETFRDHLTDKQWSVIQTAFYAGFFEWPRASTGEEVAESLGISPPTFHEHLRAAQQKLLEALLDG